MGVSFFGFWVKIFPFFFLFLCKFLNQKSIQIQKGSDKVKKIVQINLKYKVTRPELEKAFLEIAQPVADLKGLLWKVWIINEVEKSAGGIYLFKDDASVQAFHEGEIVAAIMKHPALSDIEAKVFDILPEHTKITRGPVD